MEYTSCMSAVYKHPPQVVWKGIGAGQNNGMNALDEDTFENTEPPRNMAYTKLLGMEENKLFHFKMKTATVFADVKIELEPLNVRDTKVIVTEKVEFRTRKAYVMSRFGRGVNDDVKNLLQMIGKNLETMLKNER